ncbi:hypothetical protein IWQ56_003097, partial [Coemansia nantahalensis]
MVLSVAARNGSMRRTSAVAAVAAYGAAAQHVGLLDAAARAGGYGSIAIDEGLPLQALQDDPADMDSSDVYEIADDKSPVGAFFEIRTIRQLLLEYVDVVLTPGQINTPDVQLNLVQPLWQAIRERCGVWQRGDMRHCRWAGSPGQGGDRRSATAVAGEKAGGPLASAAMMYAALANRDYFLILGSVGQSQAELHESRAEVAETLAILGAKALHNQGRRVLVHALCAKFTPIDMDGLRAQAGAPPRGRLPVPLRGDRHMSRLSEDQRVRIYRLGRAGGLAADGAATAAGTVGVSTCAQSGCASPVRALALDYLSGGSRVVAERTLEVAIRCEAKRFTAQRLVRDVVHMLWDGSMHWKGFRCVCLRAGPAEDTAGGPTPAPRGLRTPPLPPGRRDSAASSDSAEDNAEESPAGWAASDPRRARLEAWLGATLAPLRVPMLENVLTMVHAFFFLTLYTAVVLQRKEWVTAEEAMMHVFVLAYIADEVRQCEESGLAVYIKSVWNVLDVTIYTVFAVFLGLRLRSLYTASAADLDKAYDVLALNAAMLWPRLFSALDQYEFCGTVIIQVRRIISGTSLFFTLLLVMGAGFFQTFYALSTRHNDLEASNIWGLMTRIFFGSALLGWDQADLFGPNVGYLAMTLFIGVSMLVLYNILIGVINRCMMEIEQNAAQEFRFAYTMRVAEYVSANQTYPC